MPRILILDPLQHYPSLYKILLSTSNEIKYYCMYPHEDIHHIVHGFNKNEFIFNYNFERIELKNLKIFDFVFLIFPLLDFDFDHNTKNQIFIDIFKKMYCIGNNDNLIIVDSHPYNYDPCPFLQNYVYNKVLKRCYSKNMVYPDNVIPFPFACIGGKPDPLYIIIFKRNYECIQEKKKKIFWKGALFIHNEPKYKVHVNRKKIFDEIKDDTFSVPQNRLPLNQFLDNIKNHKFFLDIKGCSDLNKRFYEGLSTGTLGLIQKQDIIWPFEDGDNWSQETIFENEEEFKDKYSKLRNDEKLFKKCLENQHYIVEKYFNRDWISKYILNNI